MRCYIVVELRDGVLHSIHGGFTSAAKARCYRDQQISNFRLINNSGDPLEYQVRPLYIQ
jgi:hypothetical protein